MNILRDKKIQNFLEVRFMGKKGKKEVSPIEVNDLERIREYFSEKKIRKKI